MCKRVLLLIILTAVITSGCFWKKKQPPTVADDSNCGTTVEPVCGTDGITYNNECLADRAGATIERGGACTTPTALNDVERQYLMWILRKRIERGLPAVLIKHRSTTNLDCDSCHEIIYEWAGANATIRIAEGEIISATDSTGIDYLTGE